MNIYLMLNPISIHFLDIPDSNQINDGDSNTFSSILANLDARIIIMIINVVVIKIITIAINDIIAVITITIIMTARDVFIDSSDYLDVNVKSMAQVIINEILIIIKVKIKMLLKGIDAVNINAKEFKKNHLSFIPKMRRMEAINATSIQIITEELATQEATAAITNEDINSKMALIAANLKMAFLMTLFHLSRDCYHYSFLILDIFSDLLPSSLAYESLFKLL